MQLVEMVDTCERSLASVWESNDSGIVFMTYCDSDIPVIVSR
jgi:hypothetical protein